LRNFEVINCSAVGVGVGAHEIVGIEASVADILRALGGHVVANRLASGLSGCHRGSAWVANESASVSVESIGAIGGGSRAV